jgi:fatty acid desaturase
MRKVFLIILSVIFFLTSFWTLYDGYTPKVGPIGNGVNTHAVFIKFISLFLWGVLSLSMALILNNSENKRKLRVIHISLNGVLYALFIVVLAYLLINWNGLNETYTLPIWIIGTVFFLFISILHNYRICRWIKEGKL